MSESEQEASQVVGRPSRMSDTGQDALPDVRVRSGIPPGHPGGIPE